MLSKHERELTEREFSTHGSSGNFLQYPTAWSQWEWFEERQCDRRYRLNSRGEYEFQYGVAVPRNRDVDPLMSLNSINQGFAIQESPQSQDTPLRNYTTPNPDLSGIASGLAATTLGGAYGSLAQQTNYAGMYAVPASSTAYGTSSRPPSAYYNPSRRLIQAKNQRVTVDELDPRFKVHKSDSFEFGRVFKVLWSEPIGNGGTEITARTPARYGENTHHKIRRFVVVENRRGHYVCIPILTYDGQGTLKYGVYPDDHAVIYSSKKCPLLQGEKLNKKAIKMTPVNESEKLDPASRLNYAKLYAVEHNVKVLFIGKISSGSRQQFVTDYTQTHKRLPDDVTTGRSSLDRDISYTQGTPPYPGTQNIPASSRTPGGSASGSYGSYQNISMSPSGNFGIEYSNPTSGTVPGGFYSSNASMNAAYPEFSSYQTAPSPSYQATPSAYFPATASQYYPASSAAGGYTALPASSSTERYATVPVSVAQTTYDTPAVTSPSYTTRYQASDDDYEYEQSRRGDDRDSTGRRDNHYFRRGGYQSKTNFDTSGDDNFAEDALVPNTTITKKSSDLFVFKDATKVTNTKLKSQSSRENIENEIFGISSNLSSSSFGSQNNDAQRLVKFLLNDKELYSLFEEAARKVSLDKFETNSRQSLVKFSADLKIEAKSSMIAQSARVVRRSSQHAAGLIRQIFESKGTKSVDEDPSNYDPTEPTHAGSEYSDQNTSDDEVDEVDDVQEVANLESLLASSNALRLLKENLQLFIHPHPVKKALFKIWPVDRLRNSTLEFQYIINWEVVEFIKDNFPENQELGNVLTLTGDVVNAQAQSCQAYLTSTWPQIGGVFVDILQQALTSGTQTKLVVQQEKNVYMSFDLQLEMAESLQDKKSSLSIIARATYSLHEQVIEALSWISSALRNSPHDDARLSSVSIKARRNPQTKPGIEISLLELEEIPPSSSCWLSLFPHAVIAKDFPTRPRLQGKGLEISFNDMIFLCQSLSFVEHDGGLVVEGLRSVLVPVASLKKDNALQWHFEPSRTRNTRGRRPISVIMEVFLKSDWYRVVEPSLLDVTRCFLGWVEEAVVMIGTRGYVESPKSSGAKEASPTRQLKSHSITMGVDVLDFFRIMGSQSVTPVSMPSYLTVPIDKDMYDTLADEGDSTIIIYDVVEKISWFLPQVSVVLYLAHLISCRRQYQLYDGDNRISLGFSSPNANGAAEALKVLLKSLRYTVEKPYADIQTPKQPFYNTIRDIWHLMDLMRDELGSAITEFKKVGDAAPKFLHGIEFNDLINMERRMPIRQVEVDKPWVHLADSQALVLFCSGLKHPILPKSQNTLCSPWLRVPSGSNYMVASAPVICSILEKNDQSAKGTRLSENIEWVAEKRLIQSHCRDGNISVIHQQKIRFAENAKLDINIQAQVQAFRKGCFIFTGPNISKACVQRPNQTRSSPLIEGSQDRAQVPIDVFESASDTSGDTANSSAEKQRLWSLISYQNSPAASGLSTPPTPQILDSQVKKISIHDLATPLSHCAPSLSQTTEISVPIQTSQKYPKRRNPWNEPRNSDAEEVQRQDSNLVVSCGRAEPSLQVRSIKAFSQLTIATEVPQGSRWKGKGKETYFS